MNFFEHQDRARQNTKVLLGLFIVAVVGMVITIYIAALFAFGVAFQGNMPFLWYLDIFVLVAVPTIAVIGCGSFYKLVSLRQGGKVIAQDLGGRLVVPGTVDPAEQQLLNVVEEMAIAAGISVPAVYVLDHEAGINAFAAGFTANDAVIGVTRGTLDLLNRDELQGVIGHEFSHVLNGDMRLNLHLVGLLHGILMIYVIGRILFRSSRSSRSKEKGNPLLAFGCALIVIGGIGLVCGRLIKSAVSRQREFLADASAVQFTRNPAGIAGALLKISNHAGGALIHSPYAEANSHLFFGSAIKFNFLGEFFATHPPLSQRIRKLQSLEGRYAASAPTVSSLLNEAGASAVMGLATGSPTVRSAQSSVSSKQPRSNLIQVTPEQMLARVGTVTPEQFAQTQVWLNQLPDQIRTGLHNQYQATAIVYALLMNLEDSEIQEKQKNWLLQFESAQMVEDVLKFSQIIRSLDTRMRLPLLDLTVPALRQSSVADGQKLFKCMNALAKAAGRWSLNDFVVYLVLFHRLKPCHSKATHSMQHTKLESIWTDCLLLLSALAQVGQTGQDAITYAFRSGLYRLPGAGKLELPDAPPACNFSTLNQSLQRLSTASPKLKQAIVDACAHTVLLDQKVTVQEADLLRAIVITLDCPIPPFLRV
ncbi:M48 family metallopeptidase [Egbenema bharatensis]|uniref:M48 family metallopeptidase n=1 Tax=Egbenema bharatensis TaxID=3463334 RepID=UPI003A83E194